MCRRSHGRHRCRSAWIGLALAGAAVSSSAHARTAVTAEDAAAFQERGHLLTRGTLDLETTGILAERLPRVLAEHGRRAFGGEGSEKEVRFTFAAHELDHWVKDFINSRDGPLWQAASSLVGGKELCVLMDRGFSKDPGDPETHWHRDDEAISLPGAHPSLRTVHAWIPMSKMGKDFGTLQYMVGTHRREYGMLETFMASLWGWDLTWWLTAPVAQDDAMDLGDIAWHDGWVVHSAGSNSADAVRDGYAVSFAYCADSPKGCGGAALWKSADDVTCRVADHLFNSDWRKRHRRGEEDYAKTAIEEPVAVRAARCIWRSVLGAGVGLAVHWVGSAAWTRYSDRKKSE